MRRPKLRILLVPMAAACLWGTSGASAQSISKQGFNFNPSPCPSAAQYQSLPSIGTDRFSDGTPLPSCGGTFNGTPFKMIWTGRYWAVYGALPVAAPCPTAAQYRSLPSVTSDKAPNGTPLPSCGGTINNIAFKMVWTGRSWAVFGSLPAAVALNKFATPGTPSVQTTVQIPVGQVMLAPQGSLNGQTVALVDNNWYQLITNDGGTWTARLVASGGGNLVAAGAGNVIPNVQIALINGGSANIVLKGGANLTQYKAVMHLR